MTNNEKNELKKILEYKGNNRKIVKKIRRLIYILTAFAIIAIIGMVWCIYKG